MSKENYFSYYTGSDVLPENVFKISPSRISKFLDDTSNWYRECVLDQAPMFAGNTASFLGTTVHGLADMYNKTGKVDYGLAEDFIGSITDLAVDKDYIRKHYQVMAEALISQFLSKVSGKSEVFMYHEVIPGVVVGGSIDLLCPTEIVDYKTTSANHAPTAVKREYWFQQMCYAWMAKKKGINIERFRLVYVTTNDVNRGLSESGRRLTDYPTEVASVVHTITPSDLEIIDGVIHLVAESVAMYKSNPKMRHLLAQDMRLKEAVTFMNR